ncbi:MAG: M90 family metallopeptidase [Pseudomonadota bacterium]
MIGLFVWFYYFKRFLSRKKLLKAAFPGSYIEILKNNMKIYNILPDELKKDLHSKINVFLSEKSFEGCGGLELNDEIRLTIAGSACILLLNRKTSFFSRLESILVYPSSYLVNTKKNIGGQFVDDIEHLTGESWSYGTVVLAWDHVKRGVYDIKDGQNVVMHEFAHQLDQEDGQADGAPILEKRSAYKLWAQVLGSSYHKFINKINSGNDDVIDDYGATDPAEFFSVVTETFFEKPKQLKNKYPELYEEFKKYYKLDPVSW